MMASTTLAAHSASPFANLPSYNGLRHYYKVRNNQIFGGRNLAQGTMSATSVNPGDQCPDTSKWPSADSHNSEYVVAQHVAMEVSTELANKYPIVRHSAQDLNAIDGPHANVYANVVKYMIHSSKNPQDKDETDYFLKIEVDASQFKYIIAHVLVTPEHLSILHQTWTTST